MVEIIILFTLIHIIGDFYVQTENLSRKKTIEVKYVYRHVLVYILVSLVVSAPFLNRNLLINALIIGILHGLIDLAKFHLQKKYRILLSNYDHIMYLLDQLIHLTTILLVGTIIGNSYSLKLFAMYDINYLIKYLLAILILFKPVNVTFKKTLYHTKPSNTIVEDNLKKRGRIIGNMERLLIFLLLSVGQYTAIGLVFTAKSVTRYDAISESKEFAEYYLIGSLFSILSSILVFLALFTPVV